VGVEASSAGYSWEAKTTPVLLPWQKSGRMAYEKIEKQKRFK
jgi:hypothetical protein